MELELAYVLMIKRARAHMCVFKGGWCVVSGEPHASAALLPGKGPLITFE
jgi:hypothetical protein